jgi:diguanylate cyclase (GGDEF)-like protein
MVMDRIFPMTRAAGLKRFNDRYVHAVGDEVLKGLARCLSAAVHRPDDLVAWIGGEEFVILLADTVATRAMRIARKVHEAVATLGVPLAGIWASTVTVSIGLATGFGSRGEQAEVLYRATDIALYEAKASGRNQTRCAVALVGRGEDSDRSLRSVGANELREGSAQHRRPG